MNCIQQVGGCVMFVYGFDYGMTVEPEPIYILYNMDI